MRFQDVGLYNSFEDVERSELRQIDSAFMCEMTDASSDAFYDAPVPDGFLGVSGWDEE